MKRFTNPLLSQTGHRLSTQIVITLNHIWVFDVLSYWWLFIANIRIRLVQLISWGYFMETSFMRIAELWMSIVAVAGFSHHVFVDTFWLDQKRWFILLLIALNSRLEHLVFFEWNPFGFALPGGLPAIPMLVLILGSGQSLNHLYMVHKTVFIDPLPQLTKRTAAVSMLVLECTNFDQECWWGGRKRNCLSWKAALRLGPFWWSWA